MRALAWRARDALHACAVVARRGAGGGRRAAAAARGDIRRSASAAPRGEAVTHGYGVVGVGRGASSSVDTSTGHAVATDVPRRMGGKDAAPQPVELVLAALVGCESATAAFVARHLSPRLRLHRLAVTYEAERDPRGATHLPLDAPRPAPARLRAVRGEAVVHLVPGSPPETPERVEELRRYVEQRCPVANMLLASGCELDVRWRLASPGEEPPP